MIRLISARQARELKDAIPALAVLRMIQLEGEDGLYDPQIHGHIVILQDGDDIRVLPEIGPTGLLELIDSECPGYEYLERFSENDRWVYEMVIQIDDERTVAVIIPDTLELDGRLRQYLESAAITRIHPLAIMQGYP